MTSASTPAATAVGDDDDNDGGSGSSTKKTDTSSCKINFNEELREIASSLESGNTTLLTLNLGDYFTDLYSSKAAGDIQTTLMLNARLASIGGTGDVPNKNNTLAVDTSMPNVPPNTPSNGNKKELRYVSEETEQEEYVIPEEGMDMLQESVVNVMSAAVHRASFSHSPSVLNFLFELLLFLFPFVELQQLAK